MARGSRTAEEAELEVTEEVPAETPVETQMTATVVTPNLSTIPEGTDPADVVTPVELAHELTREKGELVRPQIVYGWIRTGGLPFHKNAKGTHVILRPQLAEWLRKKEERKAERAEKAAAAATKVTTKSSGGGKATPSVSETLTAEEVEE